MDIFNTPPPSPSHLPLGPIEGLGGALYLTLRLPRMLLWLSWPASLEATASLSLGVKQVMPDQLDTAALQAEVDRLKALAAGPSDNSIAPQSFARQTQNSQLRRSSPEA